jgi:hypothetical protein
MKACEGSRVPLPLLRRDSEETLTQPLDSDRTLIHKNPKTSHRPYCNITSIGTHLHHHLRREWRQAP